MSNRTTAIRIQEAISRLKTEPNVWIATGSMAGLPHVIPLSLAWIDDAIVVATPTGSPTVRNAAASGRGRATLDSANNVVIVDADVTVSGIKDADPRILSDYINRVGWDPREQSGDWSLLILQPDRVQAWSSVNEIQGRTIMLDGIWLTS